MVNGTSNKFVPAPQTEEILEDLLIRIKRFKNSARWKEFWRNKIQDNTPKEPGEFHQTGYRTNLRNPNYSPEAPKGSKELEGFLQSLERELITSMLKVKSAKKNKTSKQIEDMMAKLRTFNEIVIVPTDKTNSYKPLDIKIYGKLVIDHLLKSGAEIKRSRLVKIHENAMELLTKLKPTMTKDEFFAVRAQIQSKSIPTPKLLVKDHKKIGADGLFPTRLLCPASNFTACFPKLGYLGIKRIFDSNKINYAKRNIVQASDLKVTIDQLMIREGDATIIKYDAEAMYS